MQSREIQLFESPTVRVMDYQCHEEPNSTSSIEYTDRMEIIYTRAGHFLYRGFKEEVAIDNTLLLLKNEGSEHRITHDQLVRDKCTAFYFSKSILKDFEFPVTAIPVTPRLDYLHSEIFAALSRNPAARMEPALKIDALSMHFLEETFRILSQDRDSRTAAEIQTIRARHRDAVERAKDFILQNFTRDLTLKEIARSAYISEFHFSRIFRMITSRSPHQFLRDVRLNHASLLLRETSLPVTDICFACGFNNFPHFITSFTQHYGISPLRYSGRTASSHTNSKIS